MERLSGLDATMLYTETASAHMHTLKVAVLDPSGFEGPYDRARLLRELEARLPVLPSFRQRAVTVPLHLHHPVWVDDGSLDLDDHVHAMELPPPGGMDELQRAVSVIHSEPLPRDRPLWEMTLVTGLASGNVAIVAKIHHAMADGMAALTALVVAATAPPPDADPPDLDVVPSRGTLFVQAFGDRVRSLGRIPDLARRTVRGVRARRRRGAGLYDKPPAPLGCPATPINGRLTPRRSVALTDLPLAEIKQVKTAHRCTVNDVILAITAGALRSVLDPRGGIPETSLICAVPVSIDAADAPPRTSGNRTGQLFTALRTDIADPVERLLAIHHVTRNAKILNTEMGPELTHDWNEFASPAPYQFLWGSVMRRVTRPSVNVVVSNVPGPPEPVDFAGAKMVEFYSASVLTEGVGHNVTVWSYLDRLWVGYTTCPDLLDDATEVTDAMRAALEELLARS